MQEAGEILSNMNHPAGDCPLCLYPLVGDDKDGSGLPFMKLMSCYHCFHRSISFALTELYCSASNLFSLMLLILWYCSRCIMRWWEWLQHGDANPKDHNTGGANTVSCLSIFRSI